MKKIYTNKSGWIFRKIQATPEKVTYNWEKRYYDRKCQAAWLNYTYIIHNSD